jgi:hypothetical protein
LIGWRQTPNHIHFFLLARKKPPSEKKGFDDAVSFIVVDFSTTFVLNHATQLLQQPSNLTELYGLGITEDEVLAKVSEYTPFLAEWGTRYFVDEPHPIHSVIDFKDGGVSKSAGDSRVALCVSQVLDIEECVWSPKFGLKGTDFLFMNVCLPACLPFPVWLSSRRFVCLHFCLPACLSFPACLFLSAFLPAFLSACLPARPHSFFTLLICK